MRISNVEGPLDPSLIQFLTSQLSIQVAACSDAGEPTLARALGARMSADGHRLALMVPVSQARELLTCIAANGHIAAVFNEPETHRTVQLKGNDARIEAISAADAAALGPYVERLARRLQHYQVPEAFSRAFYAADPADLVAVSFSPSAVYGQTPGPHAGEPLKPGKAP
ncbi:hypothetical protein [Marinobacterium sedimentorum]|uniref:hypothetical protein n=1 Tax=Marinobacterium sedimentorum TaxID=2927804 RepID=UPI0020C6AE72|nr:hypothetical protein [Marinobacterium sedimentorum]MCP8689320.1 hypothetical protein [Marinobacterium sedimentorum]